MKSRYKYVEYLNHQWHAVVRVDKQVFRAGIFPLTDEGEKKAHEAGALRLKQYRNSAIVNTICNELEAGAIHYEDVYRIIRATQINNPAKRPSIDVINDIVCEHFGVDFDYISQNSRRNKIRYPRQVAMYLMRKFGHIYHEIGRYYGRDHTTVIHTFQMMNNMVDVYPHVATLVKSLQYKIITNDTIRTIHNRPTQGTILTTGTTI